MIEFVVLDLPDPAYNIILGRTALNAFQGVVSTYYLKVKFPTRAGYGEVWGDQVVTTTCYVRAVTQKKKEPKDAEGHEGKKSKEADPQGDEGARNEKLWSGDLRERIMCIEFRKRGSREENPMRKDLEENIKRNKEMEEARLQRIGARKVKV